MKDLEKQNEELTLIAYILLFAFLIVAVLAIVFINKSNQYEKDIVMIVKDVSERQSTIDNQRYELTAVKAECESLREANEALKGKR